MKYIIRWIKKIGLSNIVWVTDLDHTIIDSERGTNKATVPGDLQETCQRLDSRSAGFYIVTGRDLDSVDNEVFPTARFRLAAEFNNVMRFDPAAPARTRYPLPPWHVIDGRLEKLAGIYPGVFIKKMQYFRSVMYFLVPEDRRRAIRDALALPLADLIKDINEYPGAPPIRIDDFDGSFDINIEGVSKGPVIGEIVEDARLRNGHEVVPVYFGDSNSDIPAGRAAQENGGKFVSVGDDPEVVSSSNFHLSGTAETRALFAAVAWESRNARPGPRPSCKSRALKLL